MGKEEKRAGQVGRERELMRLLPDPREPTLPYLLHLLFRTCWSIDTDMELE